MRRGELYRVARPPARDPKALSRVRRSQPTGADRFAVLDDHLRAGVLNAPRTRNASRGRTERRTSTRQQRALRRACQLAEVAVDSVRRDLRHHQTQVSRRCTDGCTGAAPQLERTSGWGYSLDANPIRRQEPSCPDRCCDSQRIRCTRTALVFPVPRTGFPCSPQKIPCSTKQIPCSVA